MTETVKRAIAYTNANEFLKRLYSYHGQLSLQEMRTLKGQALAGDITGAEKGLATLLLRRTS